METVVYTLPSYYACAFYYGDYSGLEEQDIEEVEQFIKEKLEIYAVFNCVGVSEETEFLHRNDMNNLGADCLEYTFVIN